MPLKKTISLDPSSLQRMASSPQNSVWVDASAGTGKTKVLTDRVLRLLLAGTAPSKILCLTFTKAAAAEMQHRIFQRLSLWSTCPQETLFLSLKDLLGYQSSPEQVQKSRVLFFDLLDDPYGLKVQTIHGFCQKLLGRFPREAGIQGDLKLMDEAKQTEISKTLLQEIILKIDGETSFDKGGLSWSFQYLMTYYKPSYILTLLQNNLWNPGCKQALNKQELSPIKSRLESYFNCDFHQNSQLILSAYCVNAQEFLKLVDALKEGSENDQKKIDILKNVAEQGLTPDNYKEYAAVFFTTKNEPRKRLATKKVEKNFPQLISFFEKEIEKLTYTLPKLSSQASLEGSYAFSVLLKEFMDAYGAYKTKNSCVDFDDLVSMSADLLSKNQGVSWVLYKLDGGLDHIMVDEAQDTSPDQWQIILKLAEDFFTGETARKNNRTLFVVGDRKQSIYSFQGAEPDLFNHLRFYFENKIQAAQKKWLQISLDTSFRSTAPILDIVDAVFQTPEYGLKSDHQSFKKGQWGRLSLWPLVSPEKDPHLSLDEESYVPSPSAQLAQNIAEDIKKRLADKSTKASHFLILVQRRSSFMYQMIRALKKKNIPIAGPDRFQLMDHLAAQDLVALGQFLMLTQNDYALASVLKSPLFDLNDNDLMCLRQGKDKNKSLWQAIQGHTSYERSVSLLKELLQKKDQGSLSDLYAYVLKNQKGRQKFRSRMGGDCDDVLDEFMNLSFTYEHQENLGLQGFISYIHATNPVIKRDFSGSDLNAVRIMTVHGAKGLQAPIVYLPDTVRIPLSRSPLSFQEKEQNENQNQKGTFLVWHLPSSDSFLSLNGEEPPKEDLDEYYRLLYVAMTRAENELIIMGFETTKETSLQSWYKIVEDVMVHKGKKTQSGKYVYESGTHLSTVPILEKKETILPLEPKVPSWISKNPMVEIGAPEPLSPSLFLQDIWGDSDRAKPDNEDFAERAKIDGFFIHKLLEELPIKNPMMWGSFAEKTTDFFSNGPHLPDFKTSYDQVKSLLINPSFQDIFFHKGFAEVAIQGEIDISPLGLQKLKQKFSGQIDRLIFKKNTISVVDFKTSYKVPKNKKNVPRSYLGQIYIYARMIEDMYPNCIVIPEIIWVRSKKRLSFSCDEIAQILKKADSL